MLSYIHVIILISPKPSDVEHLFTFTFSHLDFYFTECLPFVYFSNEFLVEGDGSVWLLYRNFSSTIAINPLSVLDVTNIFFQSVTHVNSVYGFFVK